MAQRFAPAIAGNGALIWGHIWPTRF